MTERKAASKENGKYRNADRRKSGRRKKGAEVDSAQCCGALAEKERKREGRQYLSFSLTVGYQKKEKINARLLYLKNY